MDAIFVWKALLSEALPSGMTGDWCVTPSGSSFSTSPAFCLFGGGDEVSLSNSPAAKEDGKCQITNPTDWIHGCFGERQNVITLARSVFNDAV